MLEHRISKVALHWTPPDERKSDRPRTTWRRTIKKCTSGLEERGFSVGQAH
jgi:hypothetical protein